MTTFSNLSVEEQVDSILPLAHAIVSRYDVGEYEIESINHEFNSTFRVECATGEKFALRINVNSQRTLGNLRAEIHMVSQLASVSGLKVPKPIPMRDGSFFSSAHHPLLGRELWAVLYSWLEGEEIGDEPGPEALASTGRAMALMHDATRHMELPKGCVLPVVDQALWVSEDRITGSAFIGESERAKLAVAMQEVQVVTDRLYENGVPQPLHGDVHPWNVMWDGNQAAIFDFDDSVRGLPVQDLAVALYYLDTQDQRDALVRGYREIAQLPPEAEWAMDALLLQRRIYLLNYILESTNPEHRSLLPGYLAETVRRVEAHLESN